MSDGSDSDLCWTLYLWVASKIRDACTRALHAIKALASAIRANYTRFPLARSTDSSPVHSAGVLRRCYS